MRNMSNRRAEMRRAQREEYKLQKNKGKDAELMRAQKRGFENGKVISAATVIQALYTEIRWDEDKINSFAFSVADQKNSNATVVDFAATVWRDKLEKRIEERATAPIKMVVRSAIQSIEYRNRNVAYLNCCAFMFTNLYSNFNLSSNNKGTGKLDKVIEKCVQCWYDFMQNPDYYSNEKCKARTKEITGVCL